MGAVVKLCDRGNNWRCRGDERTLVHVEHLSADDFDQGFGPDGQGGPWFGEACASAYDALVEATNGQVEKAFHMKGGVCTRAPMHTGTLQAHVLGGRDRITPAPQ